MVALVAADTGKAAFEVAAVQELVNDFGDDGTQDSEVRRVVAGIAIEEVAEVAVNALPEGRFLRISGAIKLHVTLGRDRAGLWVKRLWAISNI